MTIGIQKEQLEALASLGCTQGEMASFFKCHKNTIAEHVTKHWNCDFRTFQAMYLDQNIISLRRIIWKAALKGGNGARDVHCLKLACEKYLEMREGMNVHNTHTGAEGGPIQHVNVDMSLDQLKAELTKRGLPTSIFEK